jgi:hypothetical protein
VRKEEGCGCDVVVMVGEWEWMGKLSGDEVGKEGKWSNFVAGEVF